MEKKLIYTIGKEEDRKEFIRKLEAIIRKEAA